MGSMARAEGKIQAVDKADKDNRSVDGKIADGISAGLAKMEVMWAQKYAKAGSKGAPSGKA